MACALSFTIGHTENMQQMTSVFLEIMCNVHIPIRCLFDNFSVDFSVGMSSKHTHTAKESHGKEATQQQCYDDIFVVVVAYYCFFFVTLTVNRVYESVFMYVGLCTG